MVSNLAAPVKTGVPALVKVIGVLYYIGAAVGFLLAVLAFVAGPQLARKIPILALFGALAVVIGVVFVGLGVLSIFVGRGLFKAQNWARIVAIVLGVLGVVGNLVPLFHGRWGSIVSLLVSGGIAGYLLFSRDVKAAF